MQMEKLDENVSQNDSSQVEDDRKRSEPILHTVDKAIKVLEEIIEAGEPIGVTELARRVDINPSTTYRILYTLRQAEIIEQDAETSRYVAGVGLLRLSGPLWSTIDPIRVARPRMDWLSEQTGESVNLLIPVGDRGMYVDNVESNQSLRMVVDIGVREQLHHSAVGKAILAFVPIEKREYIINEVGLERKTANTITDPIELAAHLEMVRERGFALDDEEGTEGTRCIGAPIFDGRRRVVAAVSVSGPTFRLSIDRLYEIAPIVLEAAREISKRLGYTDSS